MFDPTHSIEDIIPAARPAFEQLLAVATQMGLKPSVGKLGAGRTCATQQTLKAQGPGTTGAGMCTSWHVLGRALDIDLVPNSCEAHTKLGEIWESWGGTWGGRWTQFGGCGDARHYQWSGGAQSVPKDVCPPSVNLQECEAIRAQYLTDAFKPRLESKIGVWLAVTGILAAGVILWREWSE